MFSWRFAFGAEILCGVDLWLDRSDNGLGNFILHREYVGKAAIVALSPDVAASRNVI
jgi:hypothetical protein